LGCGARRGVPGEAVTVLVSLTAHTAISLGEAQARLRDASRTFLEAVTSLTAHTAISLGALGCGTCRGLSRGAATVLVLLTAHTTISLGEAQAWLRDASSSWEGNLDHCQTAILSIRRPPFLDVCIESRYSWFPTRADQVSLRLLSEATGRDNFLRDATCPASCVPRAPGGSCTSVVDNPSLLSFVPPSTRPYS
jgi:hypothetical protein